MRLLTILSSTLIIVSCAFAQSQSGVSEPTRVVGTRVSVTPPKGFTAASHFPGYALDEIGASIVVVEFPTPLSEIAPSLSDSRALLKRGMTFVSRQEVRLKDRSGVLVKVTQNQAGTDYVKQLLVFGDDHKAVLIVATLPQSHESELAEKIKASLLSTVWDAGKDLSAAEGLRFEVAEMADLKIANRMVNMLTLTRKGIFPSKDINDPLFIVGQSFSNAVVADLDGFARSRIQRTASVTNIQPEYSEKVTIDNLTGYEMIAHATDSKSGQPMVIYQTILFENETYYLIQGLISAKEGDKYIAVFKEMARSFKRKKP